MCAMERPTPTAPRPMGVGRDDPDGREGRLRAAHEALDRGDAGEARRIMAEALALDASAAGADEWAGVRDPTAWPDRWLVAVVRRDPPDTAALDALVERYWKGLFGRCEMLALSSQKANDLAQEAWCRVLRARRRLQPDGNFPGYLAATAMNIWRDWNRAARRAGPMADRRIASLDAPLHGEDGEAHALSDLVPDMGALSADQRRLLRMDIDAALERLSPHLREVLVARFLSGESCAEIGRRHGRTEQTASGWVRQALGEMRSYLEGKDHGPVGNRES